MPSESELPRTSSESPTSPVGEPQSSAPDTAPEPAAEERTSQRFGPTIRWTGGTVLAMLAAASVAFGTAVGTDLVHAVNPHHHTPKPAPSTRYLAQVITATAADDTTSFLKWPDTAAGCSSATGPTPEPGPVSTERSPDNSPCPVLFDWNLSVSGTPGRGMQMALAPNGPSGFFVNDKGALARGGTPFRWTLAPQANGTYELQTTAGDACLTMGAPGHAVSMDTCNPNNVDQDWSLTFLASPKPSASH